MIFWLVLKFEISSRVTICRRILVSFRGFLKFILKMIFCMVKYLSFHNSSFAFIYIYIA
jgi:hypothetical protein